MERFAAVHKQTREIIRGTWQDVCDLDNRVWKKKVDVEVEPEPIAIIEIKQNSKVSILKEIYSHHDLMGVYLGIWKVSSFSL